MDVSTPTRLNEALTATGTTQQDLADKVGVVKATVLHWCSGRNELSIKTAEKIAEALNIRAAWLAFGDGPMRESPSTPITTVPPPERISTPPPQPPARAQPSRRPRKAA